MYYNDNRKSIVSYILIFLAIGGIAAYFIHAGGSKRSASGLSEPVQTEAKGGTSFTLNGYDVNIDYLYEYDATALVVHTKDYPGSDIGCRLSPKDVALAWGSVAAYNELIDFHWSQSGRWVRWRTDSYSELSPVGGEADVDRQSSNNHMVPADLNVKKDVEKIRKGDIVRIKGYLINISAKNSKGTTFTWRSSTSREDSGDGACELIYVTSVEWIK